MNRKRICIILTFALIISLVFSACGNGKIEKKLIGTWSGKSDMYQATITFKENGQYNWTTRNFLGTFDYSGVYEVKDDKIILYKLDTKVIWEEMTYEYYEKTEILYIYDENDATYYKQSM